MQAAVAGSVSEVGAAHTFQARGGGGGLGRHDEARAVRNDFSAAFNYCKIRLFDYGGAMNGLNVWGRAESVIRARGLLCAFLESLLFVWRCCWRC